MIATPALLAAATGVGIGHAVLPDHWVPLALLGRTRGFSLVKVARLSALAGVAHVLVSLILGVLIVAVGLQFRSAVQSAEDAIVGGLLIATGVAFAVLQLGVRHEHTHGHDHEHSHSHAPGTRSRAVSLVAVAVPFGAAASPDLTILPVFLAAAAVGPGVAIGSLLAFAAATIATIVVLTLLATAGGLKVQGRWLDRWGNKLTAVVLVAIGCLIATGVL